MARTPAAAQKWARGQITNPIQNWYRYCLKFVRMAFGLDGGTPDAGKAWDWARYKHRTSDPNSIPANVPVFWELPSVADHVAYSVGGGWCLSNDIRRTGKIDLVRIDEITRRWGGRLLGWTEDLNGKRVYSGHVPTPQVPAIKPVVDLSKLIAAAKNDPKGKQGSVSYPAGVKIVERALKSEGLLGTRYAADGSYGSLTVAAYKKWQDKLGFRGAGADGIPGSDSLRKLGNKHGFKVVS